MPGGNGCKAATQRKRAAQDANSKSGPTTAEDRKKQQAANTAVQCKICFTAFSTTVKLPELQQHFDSKHNKSGKTFDDAFPGFNQS